MVAACLNFYFIFNMYIYFYQPRDVTFFFFIGVNDKKIACCTTKVSSLKTVEKRVRQTGRSRMRAAIYFQRLTQLLDIFRNGTEFSHAFVDVSFRANLR